MKSLKYSFNRSSKLINCDDFHWAEISLCFFVWPGHGKPVAQFLKDRAPSWQLTFVSWYYLTSHWVFRAPWTSFACRSWSWTMGAWLQSTYLAAWSRFCLEVCLLSQCILQRCRVLSRCPVEAPRLWFSSPGWSHRSVGQSSLDYKHFNSLDHQTATHRQAWKTRGHRKTMPLPWNHRACRTRPPVPWIGYHHWCQRCVHCNPSLLRDLFAWCVGWCSKYHESVHSW